MSRLRSLLAGTDQPVNWGISVLMALAVVGALLVGRAVGTQSPTVTVITAIFVCFAAAIGPLRMALRLVVALGVAAVGAMALAHATTGSPWVAAFTMATVAFVAAIVVAVPVAGPLLGPLGGLIYFIAAAQHLTSGHTTARVVESAAAGVVVAVALAVLLGIRDPRKGSREAVAQAWLPETSFSDQGRAAPVLGLDGRPKVLTALLRGASLATLGAAAARRTAPGDPRLGPPLKAAEERRRAIATALKPRGRLVPRSLPSWGDAVQVAADDPGLGGPTRLGLRNVDLAIGRSTGILTGEESAPESSRFGFGLTVEVLRAVLHPDAALFRYGVQRAIALGTAMYALQVTHGGENAYWIILSLWTALQPRARATIVKAVQRSAGTLVGAGLAIVVSLVLPDAILYPAVAGVILLVGLAFMQRNYVVTAAAMGAFIALEKGVPSHNVLGWAGLRVLDTAIGCVLAILVTYLILPARPRQEYRLRRAREALDAAVDCLLAASAAGRFDAAAARKVDARVLSCLADLKNERDLVPAAGQATYDTQVAALTQAHDDLRMLALLVVHDPASEIIPVTLETIRQEYAATAAAPA